MPLCTAIKASGKPSVSVVILLNAERYIESVFTQTHGSWELLVAEGSTDSSTRRPLEYTERRPGRVRRLEHREHKNRHMIPSPFEQPRISCHSRPPAVVEGGAD